MFTHVAIISEGQSAGPGETGEIVIDGPTVTPGYLDDQMTQEVIDERGLHTGDLGYRDEDGKLYVVGRIDNQIVTGGENVDPGKVSDIIESHPNFSEAVVIGIEDDQWGERVGTLVVPQTEADITPDTIKSICREKLAPYQVPKSIVISESIPRTISGTIDREAVIERMQKT